MSPTDATSSRDRGHEGGRAAFVAAVEAAHLLARKLAAIRGRPSPPPWPGAGLDRRVIVAALVRALDRVLHAAADLPSSDLSGLHDLTPGGHFAVYARDALTICQGLVARLSVRSTPAPGDLAWLECAAAGLREALAAATPPGRPKGHRGSMGARYSMHMSARASASYDEIRASLHGGKRVQPGTIRGHVEEANSFRRDRRLPGILSTEKGGDGGGRVYWSVRP